MSDFMNTYWRGKAVLITGASSGLGRALVEALAPYNMRLGLLSRRVEKMEALAHTLRYTNSTFWIRACDVRHRQDVETAVADFARHTGALDVVWANSGVGRSSYFPEWAWENIEAMIDTNLYGALYTMKACADIMREQGAGTIVAIGSAASMRALPTRGIYSMTKIALQYAVESMALELPELHFTLIHPGYVDTPINQGNPRRIFLLQPDRAARLMLKAVARGKRRYIYPWQMRLVYAAVRAAPQFVFSALAPRLMNQYTLKKQQARPKQ